MTSPKNKPIFSFETVSEPDLSLLSAWLRALEEEVAAKYFNHDEKVQRFIVSSNKIPFGYIEACKITREHPYVSYSFAEGATVTIDLFIGENAFLKKGYSFEMLKQFIGFLGATIDRALIDPVKGSASIKTFQNYGFTVLGEVVSKNVNHQILGIDLRHTVKALILNEQRQLLLTKGKDASWELVGGLVGKTEDDAQSVDRMVTDRGFHDFTVGKLALFGEHTSSLSQIHVREFERFYFVYAQDGDIEISEQTRWWPLAELLKTKETLSPTCLAKELEKILKRGKGPREISS